MRFEILDRFLGLADSELTGNFRIIPEPPFGATLNQTIES
jgi:hypothetical protein